MTEPAELEGPEGDDSDALQLVPGTFPLTDIGNAERFVARYRDGARFVAKRDRWYIWTGRRWEEDLDGAIGRRAKACIRGIRLEAKATPDMKRREALESWASKSESVGKRDALLKLARDEEGMTIQVGDLDRDPWLLNCNNGTLDLRTGELHSHRRSDLITKCTNVDYDPSASSLTWEQIRWNMTGGDADLAAYLQRVAGYALTGVATEKKFFFLYGPPDSGKSTFIVSLMAAMGDYARATPFETWIDRPNPLANRDDLVSLQGVRLVTSGEVAENKHWDTSLLKQVTGGDTVVAQAKYEKPIEFIPSCTVMMAANSAPKARDDDDGFWNRCHRIPIRYVVPKEQRVKDLHAQLRTHENQRAILAWAVEGCAAWLAQGIGNAHVVSESTAEYREDNDWIGAFLEMYATDDEYAEIGTKIFRSQYEEWCKGEGQRPEATKTLARRIAKRHPTVRYVMVHGRRVWKGIRLREEGATRHEQEPQAPIPSPTELPPLQHDFGFTPDPEEETPW